MGWRSGLNTREQCGFATKAEEVIEVGNAGDGRWHNQAAVELISLLLALWSVRGLPAVA